jgi:hypothetical protein
MREGLSASEVGSEIAEHARQGSRPHERHDRILSIAEAVLLSLVTLTVAWSGYAAAEWSTESSVSLAESATLRQQASRAGFEAMELRNFDSSTFESWFTAYAVGNPEAMALAEQRFRPEFEAAFVAWRALEPESNPNAPPGPTYMAQYQQPKLAEATGLDEQADAAFTSGREAGETSDKYVRTTIFLASVLFLVGISSHFPLYGVRYALLALGVILLVVSVVQLTQLPRPVF